MARWRAADFRYFGYFYWSAARGVLRRQELRLPPQKLITHKSFLFTKELRQEWSRLFAVPDGAAPVEFSYYWRIHQCHFLRLMNSLRFNYRNVLHLAHEREFLNRTLQLGTRYQVEVRLEDIAILNRDRVVLINRGIVRDQRAREVARSTDWLFLKNLSAESLQKLKSSSVYGQSDVSEFQSLSGRSAQFTNPAASHGEFRFAVGPSLGIEYGLISGDLNPLHTSPFLSKAFGYPRPFLQGVATANAVLKVFAHDLGEKLTSLRTDFSRPLFLDQTVKLLYDDRNFELFDEEEKRVAFGHRKREGER